MAILYKCGTCNKFFLFRWSRKKHFEIGKCGAPNPPCNSNSKPKKKAKIATTISAPILGPRTDPKAAHRAKTILLKQHVPSGFESFAHVYCENKAPRKTHIYVPELAVQRGQEMKEKEEEEEEENKDRLGSLRSASKMATSTAMGSIMSTRGNESTAPSVSVSSCRSQDSRGKKEKLKIAPIDLWGSWQG